MIDFKNFFKILTTENITCFSTKFQPLKILYVFQCDFWAPLSIWGRRIFETNIVFFVEKHTIFSVVKSNFYSKILRPQMDREGGKSHIEKHTIFSVVEFCWKTCNIFSGEILLKKHTIFSVVKILKKFLKSYNIFSG